MGHEFELTDQAEIDATPEQVWDAIATGPGIDSWFMGRNEVEAGEGGTVRTAFAAYRPEHRITGWDPLERLVYGGERAPDGRFVAYEFLIEGRDGGSSVVRCVTSGFLPGDDWEDEFEMMSAGGAFFFRTLVEYLTHFAGRHAVPVTAFGPPVADWEAAWTQLGAALGLAARPSAGDAVRLEIGGKPVEGVVYAVDAHNAGIRTADALYRFLEGFRGPMVASHHVFSPSTDASTAETLWQEWLKGTFVS
ncbi:SRPBCC domain-containing protein [Amycolatopsis sp. NPDC059021]|uniref:SRPBCC family protein n=1 Tax=Amycolatopsis sp. NPDC059021 TaxID=3346704 RepID=UPI00366FA12F